MSHWLTCGFYVFVAFHKSLMAFINVEQLVSQMQITSAPMNKATVSRINTCHKICFVIALFLKHNFLVHVVMHCSSRAHILVCQFTLTHATSLFSFSMSRYCRTLPPPFTLDAGKNSLTD